MNNKMNSSILSPSGRLFFAGLVAMTILAARPASPVCVHRHFQRAERALRRDADPSGNVYIADAENNRIVKFVLGHGARRSPGWIGNRWHEQRRRSGGPV